MASVNDKETSTEQSGRRKFLLRAGLGSLPVLLTLMARAGIVTASSLAKRRKYAVVIAFVFAAVLTPPDLREMLMTRALLIASLPTSVYSTTLRQRGVNCNPSGPSWKEQPCWSQN